MVILQVLQVWENIRGQQLTITSLSPNKVNFVATWQVPPYQCVDRQTLEEELDHPKFWKQVK